MFLYQQLFCLAWGFHRALESHKCGVRSRWQSPDPNPSLPPLEETRGRSHVHSSTEEMSWERGSAGIWGMLSTSSSAPELPSHKKLGGISTLMFLSAGSGVYSMQTAGNAQYMRALHCVEA